jgi:hypothetical protein
MTYFIPCASFSRLKLKISKWTLFSSIRLTLQMVALRFSWMWHSELRCITSALHTMTNDINYLNLIKSVSRQWKWFEADRTINEKFCQFCSQFNLIWTNLHLWILLHHYISQNWDYASIICMLQLWRYPFLFNLIWPKLTPLDLTIGIQMGYLKEHSSVGPGWLEFNVSE